MNLSRRRQIALGLAAIALLGGGIWGSWRSHNDRGAIEQLLAQPLSDLSGHTRTLATWRGQTLLINFWASWCVPCRDELPELNRIAREQAGKIQVLGLAWDEPQAVADFAHKESVAYPLLILPADSSTDELLRKLGNPQRGLPFSVLVDAQGRIRLIRLGAIDRARVLAALSGPANTAR